MSRPVSASQKPSSIQSTLKEELSVTLTLSADNVNPSHSAVHKGQYSNQAAQEEQASHSAVHKGQLSIQDAQKELFTHKKQFSIQTAQEEQPSHSAVHKEQLSSSVTSKEIFSPVLPSVKEDILSRITQAIQKEYQLKIKYRSSLSCHTFTEQCAHQAECPPIHLDIVKLGAHEFDCIARLKGSELFSLTLSQVNAFLGCTLSHYTSVSPQSSDLHLNLENPYPYVRTQP